MKRCFAWTVLVTAIGACSAWAQIQRFDIPFAFHVGDRHLSAGDYELYVGRPFDGTVTVVCRDDAAARVVAGVFAGKVLARSAAAKLVFTKYGSGEYFLSQVWDPAHAAALQLPRSRHEMVTSRMVAESAPETLALVARSR